jgi:hypothetical protein
VKEEFGHVKTYVVALLVVVGVLAGFYGGFKVGQNNVSASTSNTPRTSARTPGGFAGGTGGGARLNAVCPSPGAPSPSPGSQAVARGTVSDLTSSSMTLTNTSCDVKIVFGNTVQVSKTVAGNTSDLQDNITVTIIGTRQADGSIKATTIQIGGAVFGNPGAQPSPAGG